MGLYHVSFEHGGVRHVLTQPGRVPADAVALAEMIVGRQDFTVTEVPR